jgi:hypothetical protein
VKRGIVPFLLICVFLGGVKTSLATEMISGEKESILLDEVVNCFARRLDVSTDDTSMILDKMIEHSGLEKDESTRTMFLGVITAVVKKYDSKSELEVSVDEIADEIVCGIDTILRADRLANVPVTNKGWFKKYYPWLLVGGAVTVGAIILCYVLLRAKRKREAAENERKEREEKERLERLKKKKEMMKLKRLAEIESRRRMEEELRKIKEEAERVRKENKEKARRDTNCNNNRSFGDMFIEGFSYHLMNRMFGGY